MARRTRACGWIGLLAAWLMVGAAWTPVAAGTTPAEKPKPPELTPEEQAAQAILKRVQAEIQVQKDQQVFQAQQHVATGKKHFEMQNWKDALRHFEKAVELDPANAEAQDYLKRTRSMLSLGRQEFGKLAQHYAAQLAIARELQRTELQNMFAGAEALFRAGKFVQAVEAFTRVSAKAKYLAPSMDVGRTAEDAEVYIQKAMAGIEEKRRRDEAKRLEDARTEAERIREARESILSERVQALFRQATTLFEQRRYEECRKVCDEVLRDDPTNGPAETLREAAVEASRSALVERNLKKRRIETERHWQETRSYCVPYTQVRPDMPPEKFEEVRSRTVAGVFGGEEAEPQEWEARIKEAMGKKISFDFVETPLQDVIAFISSLTDVTIVLDAEAIRDEAPTVTLRVNDMRLEAALNWVLKLVNLKYTLKDEAVFVSKPERIHDKPVLRMYDVTDLTIDIKNFQGRQQALASDGGYSSTGSSGGSGGGDSIGEDFFGDEDEDDEEEKLTGQSLVEFIKRTIAPGTWADDDMGGDVGGFDDAGF